MLKYLRKNLDKCLKDPFLVSFNIFIFGLICSVRGILHTKLTHPQKEALQAEILFFVTMYWFMLVVLPFELVEIQEDEDKIALTTYYLVLGQLLMFWFFLSIII